MNYKEALELQRALEKLFNAGVLTLEGKRCIQLRINGKVEK